MENKSPNNTISDIQSNKENISISPKENQKLIPINISLVKNIFTYPQQSDKNIIYLNDIETLNDSSLTNNLEQNSIKHNHIESGSLNQSITNSKTKSKSINQSGYLKNELISKENENHLLKKEIFKLKEDLNLSQIKILKLKQYEQNLEKIINDIKKEFQTKEKVRTKIIENLKIKIKNKDYILNSFQEKIVLKNQIIDRLKIQLKRKENQINELKRKLQKNYEIYNYRYNLHTTKEIENIKCKNNYIRQNSFKNKTNANSSKETISKKKINKTNSREKLKIRSENNSKYEMLQLQLNHSNTQRENDKNLFNLEPVNTQKVISLKKRTKIKSPVLCEFKNKSHDKLIKEKNDNMQYIRIKTNLGKRFKYDSYSDKIRENSTRTSEKSVINEKMKNLKNIFLLQGKNGEDAFLKRFSNSSKNKFKNKNLKNNIKNSFGDNTYSNMYLESGYKTKSYKIDIPKFKKRKNNSFNKINDNSNSSKNLTQKRSIIKRKFNDEIARNLKQMNEKFIFSNNFQKNSTLIKKRFPTNKINFLYTNSINDSNSVLTNMNNIDLTSNSLRIIDNNSTKSNNISYHQFKEY